MTRILGYSIVVLLLLSQSALGQREHVKEKSSSPLRLEITLPKDTVSVGDSIPLIGKVTNISKKPVSFYAEFFMPLTLFLEINGESEWSNYHGPIFDPGPLRKEYVRLLEPGESVSFTVPDITWLYLLRDPGEYSIVGGYRIGASLPSDKELHIWEGKLTSAPIKLRIW